MIVVKEFQDKKFATKEDLFKALRENKEELIATKKMQTKEADAVFNVVETSQKEDYSNKEENNQNQDPNKLKAKLVINTTNLLDSHSDVHIKGIWNKSVKEQKNLYLLQEHLMKFDKIISDNVKASVKDYNWSDLGFDMNGTTQALVFDVEMTKERNPFMFEQYSKGYVKEHSVGMRYVKIELAINSDSKWDVEEKEVWDKYINEIANKEVAEAQGYFWAITEAKIVEGSAVVKGSNFATPTISIEAVSDTSKEKIKQEPAQVTQTNKRKLSII